MIKIVIGPLHDNVTWTPASIGVLKESAARKQCSIYQSQSTLLILVKENLSLILVAHALWSRPYKFPSKLHIYTISLQLQMIKYATITCMNTVFFKSIYLKIIKCWWNISTSKLEIFLKFCNWLLDILTKSINFWNSCSTFSLRHRKQNSFFTATTFDISWNVDKYLAKGSVMIFVGFEWGICKIDKYSLKIYWFELLKPLKHTK